MKTHSGFLVFVVFLKYASTSGEYCANHEQRVLHSIDGTRKTEVGSWPIDGIRRRYGRQFPSCFDHTVCKFYAGPLHTFPLCFNQVPGDNTLFEFNKLKEAHIAPPTWQHKDQDIRSVDFLGEKLRLQGRSYAGRSEFPWVVDVRYGPTETWANQEEWANGNLITGKYVLTVCDAIVDWKAAGTAISFDANYKLGSVNYYMILKDPKNFTVMYAADYPYITTTLREDEVGTRKVESVFAHPKCNYFVLDYSIGILVIKDNPINPYPPYTSYMHLDPDCNGYQQWKLHWNAITNENERNYVSNACYVGFWGRKIYKDDDYTTTGGPQPEGAKFQYNELHNHKIRYAVQVVTPSYCEQWLSNLPPRFANWQVRDFSSFIECMMMHKNETVGVICNHDRGAPIVCNGTVKAIVLAGALPNECDNRLPRPFLVVDARFMHSLYTNIQRSVFKKVTNLETFHGRVRGAGIRLQPPLNACSLLFVFYTIKTIY